MEIWKDVVGFEGVYEVSNMGQVRNISPSANHRYGSGNILKPIRNKSSGYLTVCLKRNGVSKWCYIHHLVCQAFHGPKPSPKAQCRHGDGDKNNNTEGNLCWGTRSENEQDKARHGTSNAGSRHGMSKLTEAQAQDIKSRLSKGEKQAHLARQFGVTKSCIWSIAAGKSWSHV